MSRETKQPAQYESLSSVQLKTVAAMKMGERTYLIRQGENAAIHFQTVNPEDAGADLFQETQRLAKHNSVDLGPIEPEKVTIGQLGITPPTIRWIEKTSGLDEPIFTFY